MYIDANESKVLCFLRDHGFACPHLFTAYL